MLLLQFQTLPSNTLIVSKIQTKKDARCCKKFYDYLVWKMDSLPLILSCVYLASSKICQRFIFKEVRELELLTSLLAVVVVLLSVLLAAMTLVLFVMAPVQGQAQQNQTNQTTIKTEGLNANSLDIQSTPLILSKMQKRP